MIAFVILLIHSTGRAQELSLTDFRSPVSAVVSHQREDSFACPLQLNAPSAPSKAVRLELAQALLKANQYIERFQLTRDTLQFSQNTQAEAGAIFQQLSDFHSHYLLDDEVTTQILTVLPTVAHIRLYLGYVPTLRELQDLESSLRVFTQKLLAQKQVLPGDCNRLRWDLSLLQQISELSRLRGYDFPPERFEDLVEKFIKISNRVDSVKDQP